MGKNVPYSKPDVQSSFSYLGHRAWTELNALHPEFRPGPENRDWNREHKTYPRISYANSLDAVLAFAGRYHGTHLVAIGLNERPQPFKNEHGYYRAAKEHEIETCSTFLVDIDFQSKTPSQAQREALLAFIRTEVTAYCRDLGLQQPAYADTGNGVHLLPAIPPLRVSDHSDIAERFHAFTRHFRDDLRSDLAGLESKIDSTHDLRRMVRVYGTMKPGREGLSRFYGNERREDPAFLEHLLSLKLDERAAYSPSSVTPVYGPSLLAVYNRLPPIFESLVKRDEKLRCLWNGNGKEPASDTSSSGYDISLIRRAMVLGITDLSYLATILALRPNGSVARSGKGEDYIRRTIAKVLTGQ